jgi:hypothetical protein
MLETTCSLERAMVGGRLKAYAAISVGSGPAAIGG